MTVGGGVAPEDAAADEAGAAEPAGCDAAAAADEEGAAEGLGTVLPAAVSTDAAAVAGVAADCADVVAGAAARRRAGEVTAAVELAGLDSGLTTAPDVTGPDVAAPELAAPELAGPAAAVPEVGACDWADLATSKS